MNDIAITDIEDKIIQTLEIFPRISPSMLQIGIGSSLSPNIWRPIYYNLLSAGKIVESKMQVHTRKGRSRNVTVISLSNK